MVGEDEEEAETADESALTSRRIYLVDSGLVFNSPYPPLLRPERKVDVFLSFDFSVRKRDVEFPFEVSTYFKKNGRPTETPFTPVILCVLVSKIKMILFYVTSINRIGWMDVLWPQFCDIYALISV